MYVSLSIRITHLFLKGDQCCNGKKRLFCDDAHWRWKKSLLPGFLFYLFFRLLTFVVNIMDWLICNIVVGFGKRGTVCGVLTTYISYPGPGEI